MIIDETERAHMDKVGTAPFAKAFAFALYEVRNDRRLVGLDKLRRAIAHEAALQATGFKPRPLKLPRYAGTPSHEIQRIAEDVLDKAIIAAKREVGNA